MKGVEELSPDYSPVEDELLRVYPIASQSVKNEEQPMTNIFGTPVATRTALDVDQDYREYEVDVEYRPAGAALSSESFEEYLRTYEEAHVTQESMTQLIQEDLVAALGTEEVYVSLEREGHSRQYVNGSTRGTLNKHTQVGGL